MPVTRRGFTLIELLVGTVVAAGAAALISVTLVRQQRFYSAASEMLDVRSQLRDAGDVLATDIRGAAVASFGLPVMTDSAIEMFTTIATSIACVASAGATISLPPAALANGNTLTSILSEPDSGDLALLYAIPSGVGDSGRWETHRVLAFVQRSLATSCPPSTGFTTTLDATAGATGYAVTLLSNPDTAVRKGAPIHFLRRARYSLYRSSNGLWYLGYRRCNAIGPSVCGTIQPVSGPYRAYAASAGESGLSFRYYDAAGAEVGSTSSSNTVARVDIVMRGQSARAIGLTGDARAAYRDSVVVTVSPRNRWR